MKKLNSLKQSVTATRPAQHHTTKTAKIETVLGRILTHIAGKNCVEPII